MKKIDDTIQGLTPYYRTARQCNLGEFKPYTFIGINNITVPVKKGSRWYGWLTNEEKVFNNNSTTYFDDRVDNSILDSEGNECDIIAIPIIESTFGNDHIHVWHYLPKQYIYEHLISKWISSETTIQNIIWQTICLLLIWGDLKKKKISLGLPTII